MKKEIRNICLVCVILMLFSLSTVFAGGQGEDETQTGGIPTIRVMVNSGAAASHVPASNDLLAYQERERLSGIHVEWDVVETANFEEIVGARLAAGVDMPDVMSLPRTLYEKAQNGGLIIPLNDLIDKYAPNLTKWLATDGNGLYKDVWSAPDGQLYGINYKVLPHNLSVNIMFCEPWLKRVGMETPTTTDEFVDVLKAFRDQDANGNGDSTDEIPFVTTIDGINLLGNSFGLRLAMGFPHNDLPFNYDEQGKVSWNYVDARYKEFLKFVNLLWREGLIDKEMTSIKTNTLLERAANDVAGAVWFWSTWAYKFSDAHPEGNAVEEVPIFNVPAPIEGPFGDKYFEKRILAGGGGLTITKSCKNPDVAMQWIDFVYASPAGMTIQQWGVEGTNYKVEGGKNVEIPASDGVSMNEAMLRIGGGQPPWAHEQSILSWKARMPGWQFELDELNQEYYIDPFPPLAMTKEEIDIKNEVLPDIETYRDEMKLKFIFGQEDIDDKWNEYVATMERLGSDRLLQVYQQVYDRFLKSQ